MTATAQASATFWETVELRALGEDGRRVRGRVRIEFRRFATAEYLALLARIRAAPTIADILAEIMVSWQDVTDERDKPMPFSLENLRKLLAFAPGAEKRIAHAFMHRMDRLKARDAHR